MLDQLPAQHIEPDRPTGDRALRWSWYLLLLSWPWHLVGGVIAWAITGLAGGDFAAGEDVPGGVYPFLYVWMLTPLVASVAFGAIGWLKGHRPWAIVPALLSVAVIATITVFGADQFFG